MIQEHIKKPLADELLFGKLQSGGRVVVGLKKGELTFSYPPGGTNGPKRKRPPRRKGSDKDEGGRPKVPELVR